MTPIYLEASRDFREDLERLRTLTSVEYVTADSIDGTSDLIQVLLVVNSLALPILAKIVIESIRARKHVSLKKGGIEITGISEASVHEILQRILDEPV